MKIIKVASESRTSAVAGAIAGMFRDNHRAEVQAIGASAVNQAVKALILARGYLEEEGRPIVCVPSFVQITAGGEDRTAIRISVMPHPNAGWLDRTEPDEVMPTDTGDREGSDYMLEEETAVDHLAAPADPEQLGDQVDQYTADEDIEEDFESRQKLAAGRGELLEDLDEHTSKSPRLSGGDIDAAWEDANVGEETVGGANPTPDMDRVDDLGEGLGITYEDDEPLDGDKVARRDDNRWELNPESAEEEQETS